MKVSTSMAREMQGESFFFPT